MSDEEYQRNEYIIDVLDAFIEATIHEEHSHEVYQQAKEDLVKLINELFEGKIR